MKRKKKKTDEEKKSGEEKKPESNLLKIGNLMFPPSQQPGPMVSFGENILNRKQAQFFVLTNEFKGECQYSINVIPSILYGFTDDFSIFISAPFVLRSRQHKSHSSGIEDCSIQLEYAFYTEEFYTYYDQATVVANVTVPTGSNIKNPSTGTGSNSFFIGTTYSRMMIDWFFFTSHGGILNASSHKTRFGDQFLYQFGLGRLITNTKHWLFDWMIEVDGTYTWKDKILGVIDPDSGGNVIYVTPSLWISSYDLIIQLGIGFPVLQNLSGRQEKNDYLLEMNVGWTF